ncbi:MarR family winged helix-turn-helix transcriptional regulator [Fructilactobacillus sp. Tb1]|uniref:MarR family winged helix-turn-helix transcriptional regulator n=1 Tax=Fructilactobacillus sp. Tb1 TaxID=3422304 RepID=UPI003D2C6A74
MNQAGKNLKTELTKFLNQDHDNDDEKSWMIAQTDNPTTKKLLSKLSTRALETIEVIGKSNKIHIKDIPELVGASQPTISRMMVKLDDMGIVNVTFLSENKKEKIVTLTKSGMEIFDLHDQLEDHLQDKLTSIFNHYSADELKLFSKLMRNINEIKL